METDGPPPTVEERWRELLADAETTAAEYAADGFEPFLLHPGDVTPVTGDPYGLDVLAPGDQVEPLRDLVRRGTFDTSHVYATENCGTRVFLIVVEGDADGGAVAVVVPAFLVIDRTPQLARQATDEGVMYTHVRPPSDDRRVTFSHEDPSLFF
jgi:hypothetical protein